MTDSWLGDTLGRKLLTVGMITVVIVGCFFLFNGMF